MLSGGDDVNNTLSPPFAVSAEGFGGAESRVYIAEIDGQYFNYSVAVWHSAFLRNELLYCLYEYAIQTSQVLTCVQSIFRARWSLDNSFPLVLVVHMEYDT